MEKHNTTPKVISNQVYEKVQPFTLEDEPIAKGTILYANQYSGIDPVNNIDGSLLNILESTVGTAGNNVLVQLKKKFSTYKDGPWYIDSKDGVVYIHNRKYTKGTVHNYTYQRENGELLSVSFTMQEVYKPLAGIGSVINAMDKALTRVGAEISNYVMPDSNLPQTADLRNGTYGNLRIENGHIIESRDTVEKTMWNNGYTPNYFNYLDNEAKIIARQAGAKIESRLKRAYYDNKTSAQLKAEYRARWNKAYLDTYHEDQLALLVHRNPAIGMAYNMYKQYAGKPGYESLANYYKQELLDKVKGKSLPMKDLEKSWGKHTIILSTGLVTAGDNESLELRKKDKVQKVVQAWYNKNVVPCRIDSYHIDRVDWKWHNPKIGTEDYNDWQDLGKTGLYRDTLKAANGHIYLTYYGYGKDKGIVSATRVVNDIIGRPIQGPTKGPLNLGGALDDVKNALHNAGKGIREKQLVANMRVVGNPDLEISQQIGLYNVGKKYSGIWYIKNIVHNIEFGQGYVCDIELQKQVKKSDASGTKTVIDTRKSVKNKSTKPTTTIGNATSSGRAGIINTNNSGSSNKEWQACLDIPWTSEEAAIGDRITDPVEKAKYTKLIALRHYSNRKHPNMPQLKQIQLKMNKKTGKMTVTTPGTFGLLENAPRGRFFSRNYSESMRRTNKNKNK